MQMISVQGIFDEDWKDYCKFRFSANKFPKNTFTISCYRSGKDYVPDIKIFIKEELGYTWVRDLAPTTTAYDFFVWEDHPFPEKYLKE